MLLSGVKPSAGGGGRRRHAHVCLEFVVIKLREPLHMAVRFPAGLLQTARTEAEEAGRASEVHHTRGNPPRRVPPEPEPMGAATAILQPGLRFWGRFSPRRGGSSLSGATRQQDGAMRGGGALCSSSNPPLPLQFRNGLLPGAYRARLGPVVQVQPHKVGFVVHEGCHQVLVHGVREPGKVALGLGIVLSRSQRVGGDVQAIEIHGCVS